MKRIIFNTFFITILTLGFLSSCKPTEKGYKAAYDAALGKRQAASESLGVDLPEGGLMQIDGPQLKEIDGVKVYLLSQRIKPIDNNLSLPGTYNLAVGSYKMSTNCESQAKNLKEEGFDAFAGMDNEGKYYTIAYSSDNLNSVVEEYKKYQKKSGRVYVGLPEAPVIIFSPR